MIDLSCAVPSAEASHDLRGDSQGLQTAVQGSGHPCFTPILKDMRSISAKSKADGQCYEQRDKRGNFWC